MSAIKIQFDINFKSQFCFHLDIHILPKTVFKSLKSNKF